MPKPPHTWAVRPAAASSRPAGAQASPSVSSARLQFKPPRPTPPAFRSRVVPAALGQILSIANPGKTAAKLEPAPGSSMGGHSQVQTTSQAGSSLTDAVVSQLVSLLKSQMHGDESGSPPGQRDRLPGVAGMLWEAPRRGSEWTGLLRPPPAACQPAEAAFLPTSQPALLTTPAQKTRRLPGALGGGGIKTAPPGAEAARPVDVRTEMLSGAGQHAAEQCALSAV